MRARFLSGMLYSSFRRARSSMPPDRRGVSTRRFWLSTSAEKASVKQEMPLPRKFLKEDLVCPVKYFKEDAEFLKSLTGNELLKLVGKTGLSEVSTKAARAARSLAELILKSHTLGIACGDMLRLNNLKISRSLGKFVFIEPPKKNDISVSLLGDFKLGADLLEELAVAVLGPNIQMPKVWVDFIKKLREEFPKVEIIMYHSLFLPANIRYWLRLILDQRFRKDFSALKADEKDAIRQFFHELGKLRDEDLSKLLKNNEFLKFVSLKSRSGAKSRRQRSNSNLSSDEAVWADKARTILAINRDGVVHGCKKELDKEERNAMPNVKNHWRTPQSVIQLLCVEFELLEQTCIELCHNSKLLWDIIAIWEVFGETEDAWRAASDAINEEIGLLKAKRFRDGKDP